MEADTAAPPRTLVACLCADWCHICQAYRATFAALRSEFAEIRFVWVDIEDDAELVGDLEVETFPTLLIGQGERLSFVGPVIPQPAAARRLLEAAGSAQPGAADPAAQALLLRLQHSC
ncbi:thioredoxin family protein [Roseateles violae]|uniref:Thioredoxin family protein n=1 Tax=Roseateles violae TaxID=3058042 RepID=A0ABT8DMB3_9BURK|nr:thioredoxin family protein [Pelomonas sp. PFR6]MDN3919073.1 thioredoxin family protein [Pelomonas sp. PFR6]